MESHPERKEFIDKELKKNHSGRAYKEKGGRKKKCEGGGEERSGPWAGFGQLSIKESDREGGTNKAS